MKNCCILSVSIMGRRLLDVPGLLLNLVFVAAGALVNSPREGNYLLTADHCFIGKQLHPHYAFHRCESFR